jgi:hypothetical protein
MHAQVITVDLAGREAAVDSVDRIVPTVKAMPGFVRGYWVMLDESHGMSVTVFETEEQARAAAPPAGAGEAGVTITGVQIGEVLARA